MTPIAPFICPECGGTVRSHTGPGRTRERRRGELLTIPDDFDVPRCDRCGEEYVRADSEDALAAVLEAEAVGARVSTPSLFCCSFCGKSRDEVVNFVVGPAVNICDECVRMAAELIGEPELMARFDARFGSSSAIAAALEAAATMEAR